MKKPEVIKKQDRIVVYRQEGKAKDKKLSRRALRRMVNRDMESGTKLPKRGWVA